MNKLQMAEFLIKEIKGKTEKILERGAAENYHLADHLGDDIIDYGDLLLDVIKECMLP